MLKENHFTAKFKQKTNHELEHIVNNPSNYESDAIQAAVWILEDRGDQPAAMENALEEIAVREQDEIQHRINRIGIPIDTQDRTMRILHWIIDDFLILAIYYLLNTILPFVGPGMLLFTTFVLRPIYYIYFESKYRQTPGKMVSDSIVTHANGEAPNAKTVILRTAARYVPFEALSCLGKPSWGWHDKWTKTYVIKKGDLEKLQNQKGEDEHLIL